MHRFTQLLQHKPLQYLGSCFLTIISGGHLASALITGKASIPVIAEGLSRDTHPTYYALMLAFWAAVLSATLIGVWFGYRAK